MVFEDRIEDSSFGGESRTSTRDSIDRVLLTVIPNSPLLLHGSRLELLMFSVSPKDVPKIYRPCGTEPCRSKPTNINLHPTRTNVAQRYDTNCTPGEQHEAARQQSAPKVLTILFPLVVVSFDFVISESGRPLATEDRLSVGTKLGRIQIEDIQRANEASGQTIAEMNVDRDLRGRLIQHVRRGGARRRQCCL